MLSKFKSKLFSARGVFGGGAKEDDAPPLSKSEEDGEVGVAVSHDTPATTSEGEW